MVGGFNHNIRYKGELFHVQTEDSGRAKPFIVTLLYRGGTILCSAKTSYADIIKTDQLEMVVESIMKEQHKDMMRRLKGGDLDAKVFPSLAASQSPAEPAASQPAAPPVAPSAAPPVAPSAAPPVAPPAAPPAASKTASTEPPASSAKRSLDEVILDYLITGEEK